MRSFARIIAAAAIATLVQAQECPINKGSTVSGFVDILDPPVKTKSDQVCFILCNSDDTCEWWSRQQSTTLCRLSKAVPSNLTPVAPGTAVTDPAYFDNGPACVPTSSPTASPTSKPSQKPTAKPSKTPTARPTASPTNPKTSAPTSKPTVVTLKPVTAKPSRSPTARPTRSPTAKPSRTPSAKPSARPTRTPTQPPTGCVEKISTTKPTTGFTKIHECAVITSSKQLCASLCASDPVCVHWWRGKGTGNCWLSSTKPTKSEASTTTDSGNTCPVPVTSSPTAKTTPAPTPVATSTPTANPTPGATAAVTPAPSFAAATPAPSFAAATPAPTFATPAPTPVAATSDPMLGVRCEWNAQCGNMDTRCCGWRNKVCIVKVQGENECE